MTDENTPDLSSDERLAYLLVELNILSAAQIELAFADQEINELGLEEVLLARGWLTQEKLYNIAPWLKPGFVATTDNQAQAPDKSEPPQSNFGARKKVSSIQHPLQDWHADVNAAVQEDADSAEPKQPETETNAGGKATAKSDTTNETSKKSDVIAATEPGTKRNSSKSKAVRYEENLAAYKELKKKVFDTE